MGSEVWEKGGGAFVLKRKAWRQRGVALLHEVEALKMPLLFYRFKRNSEVFRREGAQGVEPILRQWFAQMKKMRKFRTDDLMRITGMGGKQLLRFVVGCQDFGYIEEKEGALRITEKALTIWGL